MEDIIPSMTDISDGYVFPLTGDKPLTLLGITLGRDS
jgi:hypothetical protein